MPMSKFIVPVDRLSIASQIAILINAQNKLTKVYTPKDIFNNNVIYVIELGGFNERHVDGANKVLGVCGYENTVNCTWLRHLSVLDQYKRSGIATKLLKAAINNAAYNTIFMNVRSNNKSCLYLAEKLGFIYVSHQIKKDYAVLTLRRQKHG